MSMRLQIVISEQELAEVKAAARAARLSLSEWVRQALREARKDRDSRLPDDALEALIEQASIHQFPAPEIEQMNQEIADGYRIR
ncbi:MAG: antitoxin [Actinomycetota bacterium]